MNLIGVDTSGNEQLLCPRCGWECVHITAVTVTARAEDRAGTAVHVVTTERNNVTITEAADLHGRRDNTILRVWCEECGAVTDLRFTQHKGATFVTREQTG